VRITLLVIVALGFVVLSGALPVLAEEFTFDYQKIIETDHPIDLRLEMASGKLTVSGGESDRLIIEAVKRIRATGLDEAEEVANHIEIKVKQTGNLVEISTNYLKLSNRSRSFWSKVLGAGADSYGDVDFNSTVPDVNLFKIKSTAAEIELSNLEADIDVENASGSIRGEFLFGPVTVRQPAGDIELKWVEGDIRINSNSSRIMIKQVVGAIDVLSRTGDVRFVETTTGRITFEVPESSSGVLSIETRSGNVTSQVPVAIRSRTGTRLVGEFGSGGPRITLSSSTGDVEVCGF
jgi:hypothetical protein